MINIAEIVALCDARAMREGGKAKGKRVGKREREGKRGEDRERGRGEGKRGRRGEEGEKRREKRRRGKVHLNWERNG